MEVVIMTEGQLFLLVSALTLITIMRQLWI
jgi:hypothetical protein